MDIELIGRVLSGAGVAQWQVTERRSRRHERYLTFLRREHEREASAVRWDGWFALPAADGRQGEGSFTVGGGDTPADLRARLDAALAAAPAALMPAFRLPEPGGDGVAVPVEAGEAVTGGAAVQPQRSGGADPALVANPGAALDRAEAAWGAAVAAAPWTRPSHLELFATVEDLRLRNHHGLDLRDRRTRTYAEFVLLHRPDGGREVEVLDRAEAADLAGLHLDRRTGDAAAGVRALAGAVAPRPGPQPVLLRGEHLAELLGWICGHADAALHARGIAALALGAPVLAAGAAPDLTADARVPSLAAYRFDHHGYAAAGQPLVRDGRLEGLHGDGRWMQVLGRSPRGVAGTLVCPPGAAPVEDLRQHPGGVLEVVRFSEFHARQDTGAFSGEIRLGWWHEPGRAPRAVRGGSVSGTVREALAGLVLAAECATEGGFHGPVAARIDAVVAA
ncbi:MAG: hypothetical protein RLZZ127_1420 [Planctomycetota bacterium]|jgi:predicted Zn-dependent protease